MLIVLISLTLLGSILTIAYVLLVAAVVALIVMENRNPLKSLAWITVLLLFPVVGLLLYLFFGRSLRNRRMISRRGRRKLLKADNRASDPFPTNLSAEARTLATVARSLNGTRFHAGNTAKVFADGHSKFESLKHDLQEAKEYILLQYYIFDDDNLGREIKQILMERARSGVKVFVIYDDLGSLSVKNRFYREMEQAGVEVSPFFKLTWPHLASRANWRNHRKLCVIDGKTGYIGGMNIADRYIDGGEKFDSWRDTHLRITGPAVTTLQYSFAVDWNFIGRELILLPPSAEPHVIDGKEAVGMQLITGGPTDRWSNLGYWFIKAIANARKRVWIQTPYFLPSEGLLNALQVAALARIDIRVMVPVRSDSKMLTFATRSFVEECLRAGIKFYFYQAGMLHSKMIIIDDDIATIGSTNFDFRSLEHNFEANMILYSPSLNRNLRNLFEEDCQKSERIVGHIWRKRPVHHKITESVLRLLSPIL